MSKISKEQSFKRGAWAVAGCGLLGIVFIVALILSWEKKDEVRLRQTSSKVLGEARSIVEEGSKWTVTSIDTAFSSPSHFVVKYSLTDGDTTIKVNCYNAQRVYLGDWNSLVAGEHVRFKLKQRLISVKISDYLSPEPVHSL